MVVTPFKPMLRQVRPPKAKAIMSSLGGVKRGMGSSASACTFGVLDPAAWVSPLLA